MFSRHDAAGGLEAVSPGPRPARAPRLPVEPDESPGGPESIPYLRQLGRIPVLSRADQAALAATLRERTGVFRAHVLASPAAARVIVERWQRIRAEGRVTGTLSAGYRDGSGRDYSSQVDTALARAARLLERRAKLARGARAELDGALEEALVRANLSTGVVERAHGSLLELSARIATARGARRRELGPGAGEPVDRFRARVRESQAGLDALLEVKNRLVRHNLRLVVSVAKEFRGMGVEFADLIQEANLGLIRAVEKFDERRGFTFSTYAVWWLRQACIRAVQHHSRSVRLPSHVYELILHYRRARSTLQRKLGRDPESWELAEVMDLDLESVDAAARWSRREESTEEPLPHGEDLTLGDTLADERVPSPVAGIDRSQIRRELPAMLEGLDPRERHIVESYYGLASGDGATLERIGDGLGLSRERVRQIKAGALAKLLKKAAARGLEASLEPAGALA